MTDDVDALLAGTSELASAYLSTLGDRRVAAAISGPSSLPIGRDLPAEPIAADRVIAELAAAVEPGLVASNGGRYFGFVTGGTLPVALAADWLTSTWDQNTALGVMSPAAIGVQAIAREWLLELLDLPRRSGVGFVTGAQMANATCLATARNKVLADRGWDVETDGLAGAPPVTIVVGQHRHATIDRAVRFLGFGTRALAVVPSDGAGRMQPDALADIVGSIDGPLIVCAQAGEVNTGAFDPFEPIVEIAHGRGGWVHVDGAFGLWARACADRRYLTYGIEHADSWSADGHKWLNVPYDTGFAITAHPSSQVAAMAQLAPYLVSSDDAWNDPMNWSPEASRRARGFAVYAALRGLGRSGLDEMISGHCRLARRFADGLATVDGIEILNDVVLNQVLVRFPARDGGDGDDVDASGVDGIGGNRGDERTRRVIADVQRDGTCWAGGTTFRGRHAMRISVSSWRTTDADVDRSIEAIVHAARANPG